MKRLALLSISLVCACTKQAEAPPPSDPSPPAVLAPASATRDAARMPAASQSTRPECSFSFGEKPVCVFTANGQTVNVSIVTRKIADNELELTAAVVSINDNEQTLELSEDTSMVEGSIGMVFFDDISFDGVPDLGISTSFGTANLYLDYWIYDAAGRQYEPVGNFPRLIPDAVTQTLRADIRSDAASQELQVYRIVGNKLEREK